MRGSVDWTALRGLYAIVDPRACRGRDPLAVARAIVDGGCAVLQLRDKQASDAERDSLAAELAALCRQASTPFVVNDHPALAARVAADGVHVGQEDVGVAAARSELGQGCVGVSTHDLAQAQRAVADGADLIGFGPVFPTQNKDNPDPVVGLSGLSAVCREVRVPVVAIGGIDQARAAEVRAAGAPLGAAIGAVCAADDPAGAARALHRALGGS